MRLSKEQIVAFKKEIGYTRPKTCSSCVYAFMSSPVECRRLDTSRFDVQPCFVCNFHKEEVDNPYLK